MVYLWRNKTDHRWYTTEMDNPQLIDLFGTNTLPTPFADMTPLETVLETLRSKNPERIFTFSEGTPPIKSLFDPQNYPTKEHLLEVCVLHVLKDGGDFVLDLSKKVKALVRDPVTLTPGMLELVMDKLVIEQLVLQEEKPGHFNKRVAHFYEITSWGVQYLRDKVEQL